MWRRGKLAFCLLASQVTLIVLFALQGEYGRDANASNAGHSYAPSLGGLDPKENAIERFQATFASGFFLVYFAFGLSVSYFGSYTFSGIGLNFLAVSLSIQWAVVFQYVVQGPLRVEVDIEKLESAQWTALAVAISLVAAHGKVSALQVVVLVLLEPLFYALNEHLILNKYKVTDLVGGFRIVIFGSYFGFGLSLMLWRYSAETRQKRLHSNTINQFFVLMSTLCFYYLWPVLAASISSGDKKHRIVVNNYLAMTSAAICSFAASSLMDPSNRFSVRLIQIGVTSGAMSICCIAEAMIQPHGALLIGGCGALLAIASHLKLAPIIAKRLRVQDMFHANSAFAFPSLMSGLLNCAFSYLATVETYGSSLYEIYPARAPRANTTDLEEIVLYLDRISAGENRTNLHQAGYQALALLTTLCISTFGGIFTGTIVRLRIFDPRKEEYLYSDGDSFIMPPSEEPAFIGNESNCEMDCSQGDEPSNMQTLQIPQQRAKQRQSV